MKKKKNEVKVCIISHKRADNVKSVHAVSNACICIPEGQREEYQKNYPNTELLCHPDDVIGLAAKYRWMHENLGDFVIVADDIDYLRRNYVEDFKDQKGVVDADLAYQIIQATHQTAKNPGVKIWGFSKESNPVTYSGHLPFKLSGFVSGGIIGVMKDFQMDEISDRCVSGLDFYLSGINAYYNRMAFIDNRYFTSCKEGTFISQGGMADYRTIETEKKDLIYLKKLFGDAIEIKRNENLRKKKHGYEKTIRIPF